MIFHKAGLRVLRACLQSRLRFWEPDGLELFEFPKVSSFGDRVYVIKGRVGDRVYVIKGRVSGLRALILGTR